MKSMSNPNDDSTEKQFDPYKINLKNLIPEAPSMDVTVMPEKTIVDSAAPILCVPVGPIRGIMPKIAAGSIQDKCSVCGEAVWISPASQRIFAQGKNPLICAICILKMTKNREA
jgi:hypothetical protein